MSRKKKNVLVSIRDRSQIMSVNKEERGVGKLLTIADKGVDGVQDEDAKRMKEDER